MCRALAKRSTPFRAAVHTISKADNIKKLANNVEIVEGIPFSPSSPLFSLHHLFKKKRVNILTNNQIVVDMAKSETVDAALKGVTKVFLLIPPFAPPQVGFATIDAIKSMTYERGEEEKRRRG